MLLKVSAAEWKAIMASSAAKYEALSKGDDHPVKNCLPLALLGASIIPDVNVNANLKLVVGEHPQGPTYCQPRKLRRPACVPAADEERYAADLALYEKRNPGYSAWSAAQSRAPRWVGAPVAPPQPRQLYARSWCAS